MGSANPARVAACRALGAEVVTAPDGRTAFEMVEAIARDEGRSFIHPFEGPLYRARHRDSGRRMARAGARSRRGDHRDRRRRPVRRRLGRDQIAQAGLPGLRSRADRIGHDDPQLRAGEPIDHAEVRTIADSLAPPFALPYSFGLCRQNVDDIVLVDDDAIRSAMALLFREMKLAVEPAAAAATAALVGPLRERLAGKKVGVLVCGSNIDFDTFEKHVRQAPA